MTKDNSPKKTEPDANSGIAEDGDRFLVVGLGASAGGIQALRQFFSNVKKDSGMAYVVILHMSPEHESKLAEILQTTSPVPVTQVRDREKVFPNHVYVIPPNQNLAMADGHLELKSMIGKEERRSPVDLFFRTLAETNEGRAVSVVLSGTGANGSMGLKRVKEYGGVVFSQDPNEAEYSDMPSNAIATGMVDYVLPVEQIPEKIALYRDHIGTVKLPETEDVPQADEQALADVFQQLRIRTSHDFSNYKRGTILRRIERRLGLRGISSLSAYARFLHKEPQESNLLMKDLLISVTNFFRDSESMEVMLEKVIPRILENKGLLDPLRVWVAGCATGEEAYSLAMVLAETIPSETGTPNIQIFASDLDEDAISIARNGFYKDAEVADVSAPRLRRFFLREADGYRVKREVRDMILFAVHNVIKDPPFSHLDLVSCRNLLIYLNRAAQTRVLQVFHFALNATGFLFLGASESIEGGGDLFSVFDKEHHIFRSRAVAPRAYPIPEVTAQAPARPMINRPKSPEEVRAFDRLSYAELHQRLLEKYAAASVIVNEQYELIHLSDHAGRYLEIGGGNPSHNLLTLIRPELRLELRTALYQAIQERTNVEASNLKVRIGDEVETINLIVRPVLHEDDSNRGLILVLFEKVAAGETGDTVAAVRTPEPIARRLEEELVNSKSQLRSIVEQYEVQQEELRASNEELQAINEELRSAAEELETSKEELESVNEELRTVNQELKVKIEELSLANNNFQNLMNSTNIATIFLDRALNVMQFTPAATNIFNLIATDLGRSLTHITNKLKEDHLIDEAKEVIATLHTIEHLVETVDGRSYMLKLSPYRTLEDKIDGLVITLVDITDRLRAEELVKRAGEDFEQKVEERTGGLVASNVALMKEVHDQKIAEESRFQLLKQLVDAQEEERRRLARDLHDQLGQQLTALRLRLEALRTAGPSQQSKMIIDLQKIVNQLDTDVDFLAWELRPSALDELGLETALSNYVRQWSEHFDVPAEFHARGLDDRRLSSPVESNLYRIAQEALNNCAKHSKCSQVYIILELREHHLVLIIEDNGAGFDATAQVAPGQNMGLVGMRERATLIGGTFDVESIPGEGSAVFVRVPLDNQRASS